MNNLNQRKSNIELLRILCIMGNIVLHFNNANKGGGFNYVDKHSLNGVILYFMEALCIVGVNVFIIISGYFLCKKKSVMIDKPVMLILELIMYRMGVEIYTALHTGFSLRNFFISLLPVDYFVMLYVTLYILSPYINIMLNNMELKTFRKLLITCLILFSLWPTATGILQNYFGLVFNGISTISLLGDQDGYTIVNFILMYLIGAYISRVKESNDDYSSLMKVKTIYLYITLVLAVIIIAVWSYTGSESGVSYSALKYNNPIVIVYAVCLFLIFERFEMKYSRIINGLAKGCFGVFLFNTFFLRFVDVEKYVTGSPIMLIGGLILVCITLYIIGWTIDFIYKFIYKYSIGRFISWMKNKYQ